MSPEPTTAHELLRGLAAGDRAALEQFGSRFGPLAVELARRALPDVPGPVHRALARRALQTCLDELPRLGRDLFEPTGSVEAWVAAVCARVLHEASARNQIDAAGRRAAELLPADLPESRHFTLKAYYRAAALLGGDYYDARVRADGSMVVLVADVMGHGAPAAMLLAAVRLAFRSGARARSAAGVLGAMNRALEPVLPDPCFVEAGVLRLGPEPRECEFAGAGMSGAFVVSAARGRLRPLALPSHLLGLLPDARYEPVRLRLEGGDSIFLCTDGLRDLENDAGERFGRERLEDVLGTAARGGVDLHDHVSNALASFGGAGGWCDDVCFLTATAG
jgi:sigma-B regulation protein RsbU (phosphoserine phosphatase)